MRILHTRTLLANTIFYICSMLNVHTIHLRILQQFVNDMRHVKAKI